MAAGQGAMGATQGLMAVPMKAMPALGSSLAPQGVLGSGSALSQSLTPLTSGTQLYSSGLQSALAMKEMPPLGSSITQGITTTPQTTTGLFSGGGWRDKAFDMAGQMMSGGGGGGDPRMAGGPQYPQIQRGQLAPFQPMQFSRSNYRFRRNLGF